MARKSLIIQEEEPILEESLINITPLIDVVFVVLISFILIAPLLKTEIVDLAPAGPKSSMATDTPKLVILVKKDSSIWINGEKRNLEDLGTFLANQKDKSSLQLIHDRMAPFGIYQTIKNNAETAGFTEIELLLNNH